MVLYTPTFALSVPASEVLTKPRILHQTRTRGLPITSATASSSGVNTPPDAVLRPDTYEFFAPTSLPADLTIDMGSLGDVDSIGIGGHNFATAGVTVEVKTSPDGSTYTTLGLATAPADDGALLFLDALRSHRYAKIFLTGGLVLPQIASVYVGKALVMEKHLSPPYRPITMARDTVMRSSLSRGGQFLGQSIMRMGVKGTATFKNLTSAFVRGSFNAFSKNARQFPYFFAWNPSLFQDEVSYCWSVDDIVPEYNGNIDFMDVGWEMRGLGF